MLNYLPPLPPSSPFLAPLVRDSEQLAHLLRGGWIYLSFVAVSSTAQPFHGPPLTSFTYQVDTEAVFGGSCSSMQGKKKMCRSCPLWQVPNELSLKRLLFIHSFVWLAFLKC